jgi:hypothetical protein
MKSIVALLITLALAGSAFAELPDAPLPQPPRAATTTPAPTGNDFGKGFQMDNQLYLLQGTGVSLIIGELSRRPWIGAAAGIGSCMAYRGVHDRKYRNDGMFSSNRIAFCGLGSAGGYVINKWVFKVHKAR